MSANDPEAGTSPQNTSSDAGAQKCSSPPEGVTSQQVTFHVHNTRAAAVWIPTKGNYCSLLHIMRNGELVPQQLAFQCLCECEPPEEGPVAYHKLEPGEALDLPWMAHEVTFCTEDYDCRSVGFERIEQRQVARDKPLSAGPLRATIAFETDRPDGCLPDGAEASCEVDDDHVGLGAFDDFCGGGNMVDVDLDLPSSGSLTVDVAIP